MKSKRIVVILLAFFLLAACQPATAATTEAATPTVAAVSQATPVPTLEFQASGPGTCKTETLDLPEVTENDWILGSPDAKVTLLVYSDFQCPYCAQYDPYIDQLVKDNPDEFRLVFRIFPLPYHANADQAARAAEAAGRQGKFFEMKTALFENQNSWSGMRGTDFEAWLKEKAGALGLDADQFVADLKDDALEEKIRNSFKEGYSGGVSHTPFILVNGNLYEGSLDPQSIRDFIEFSKTKFKECPPTVIDAGKTYTATLKTGKGDVVMELFPKQAPLAVNSFVFLAREGWYDGVTFHQVLPGLIAQSGDPSGTGGGTPGYSYSNEVTPELRYDQAGRVGLINTAADANGSQFFITYSAIPSLDGSFTIFGQVTSGMDVLEKLTPRDPTQGGDLPAGDKILSIEITEK